MTNNIILRTEVVLPYCMYNLGTSNSTNIYGRQINSGIDSSVYQLLITKIAKLPIPVSRIAVEMQII